MIKITVDRAVYEALQRAFPRPSASAQRALGKYITVLETMLFTSLNFAQTPMQRKLDLFGISLQKLANRGGQIGPNRIRVHKWLRDNNLSLVETVVVGSNLTGDVSQVRLSKLVTMVDRLTAGAELLNTGATDREIDHYLSGDDASNRALLYLLFPEFARPLGDDDEIARQFDLVPVDLKSLKSYMVWLTTEARQLTLEKKNHALRQARIILAVATVMQGNYVQRKKPSVFGRMYYEGVSVQNVNKELRRAMLGNCWEYDIRSSVVAWKMGWARAYLSSVNKAVDALPKVFMATLSFLEHKADFMATVRHFTFAHDSPVPRDLQPKLLKRAFTAISFGARHNAQGWQNDAGEWTNPALTEIIKNADDRARFLADATVRAFIAEQGVLDAFLYQQVKVQRPDLLRNSHLQTPSGRPSRSKILAYLYQHDETEVMDVVRATALAHGRTPIANVHDAIFFQRKLSVDLRVEMQTRMCLHTHNPYWHLAHQELQGYEPRYLDEKLEEQAHRERIRQETLRAAAHYANLAVD